MEELVKSVSELGNSIKENVLEVLKNTIPNFNDYYFRHDICGWTTREINNPFMYASPIQMIELPYEKYRGEYINVYEHKGYKCYKYVYCGVNCDTVYTFIPKEIKDCIKKY